MLHNSFEILILNKPHDQSNNVCKSIFTSAWHDTYGTKYRLLGNKSTRLVELTKLIQNNWIEFLFFCVPHSISSRWLVT